MIYLIGNGGIMAITLDRAGEKEDVFFGGGQISELVKKREELRSQLNSMEDVSSRRDPFDKGKELNVDRARAQASGLQSGIADFDKQIAELVKKSKSLETLNRRPGATEQTTTGAGSALLGGGISTQSALTSIL